MLSVPSSADGLIRALQRAGGVPFSPGNQVSLLIDGAATYRAMHEQIASAKSRIHLENYIIRDDACGTGFAEAIMARARDGVKVRVLYDWLGSMGTSRKFWRRLRDAGVHVRAFGTPSLSDPLLMISRDHRKLLVVDGECGVSGGLCIGDEWVDDPVAQREGWRDTALAIRGPAVRLLEQSFSRVWRLASGIALEDPPALGTIEVAPGVAGVQVVATEPGRERASRAIDLMVGACVERLWVTDAYLAVSQRLYQGLQDAARSGVDVRLLLPGFSDIRVVQQLTRTGYRNLLRAGVRIWEWNGAMLHAKSMVADGRLVRIGSSNLNPSSLLANWELDLFVDNDEQLGQAMERQFLSDLDRSSEVVLRPWRQPLLADRGVPEIWLTRERPQGDSHAAPRRPTARERRRRILIAASGLIRGARAAIFGPIALLLLAVSALFLIFPTPMALVAGAASALLGAALVVRAWGHRVRP